MRSKLSAFSFFLSQRDPTHYSPFFVHNCPFFLPYSSSPFVEMLHSTLSPLLVSVASRYAQLSPSDVGIGIDGGRLVVDNVQLRAHTFNGPNIPFHVHEGRAGRLRVNIPWSALSSTPVNVYLENVHLIAGPKQHHLQHNAITHQPNHRIADVSSPHAEWHQTIVGRLLFNVSAEIYGLKVEYRDDDCVGILSIASLRATSAGPDWNQQFVSLSSDLDPDQPQASAVSMRKLVQLNGVHLVMIPRTKGAPPAAEGLIVSEEGRSPRFSERHLDLKSYESKAPILDGIAVTVRVLMCTGMALVGDSVSPGLHAEIEVDIEETSVSLTAQQLKWIDLILQKGFGASNAQHASNHRQSPKQKTRRRPRTVAASEESLETEASYPGTVTFASDTRYTDEPPSEEPSGELLHPESENAVSDHGGVKSSNGKQITSEVDVESKPHLNREGHGEVKPDYEKDEKTDLIQPEQEEEEVSEEDDEQSRNEEDAIGGFGYFWHALVGEYADETVDDAAFALGLANGYISTDEDMQQQSEHKKHDADVQYARAAVNAAAMAGGRTFKLRLKTPDMETRDEIEALRAELQSEKEKRLDLENIEDVLYKAENRIQEHESEIETLRERNVSLVQELKELEAMTARAGKNKDAIIRQMEAALRKAERKLQAMLQEKYDHQEVETHAVRTETTVEESGQHDGIPQVENTSSKVFEQSTEVIDETNDDVGDMKIATIASRLQESATTEYPAPGYMGGDVEEKATSIGRAETSSANSAELHTEETSDPEHVDGSNFGTSGSVVMEPVTGGQTSGEHRFSSDSFGVSTKNVEQAMSSEGLTLV